MQNTTAPDISERLDITNLGRTHSLNTNRWNNSTITGSTGDIGIHDANAEYRINAQNAIEHDTFNYTVTLTHHDSESDTFNDIVQAHVNTIPQVVLVMDMLADQPELFTPSVDMSETNNAFDHVPAMWHDSHNIFHGDWKNGGHLSLGILSYFTEDETWNIDVDYKTNSDGVVFNCTLVDTGDINSKETIVADVTVQNGDAVVEVIDFFAGWLSVFD